ncbi:DUF58 domain-containing protein [Flagellimonas halotolerans]|uniref:DUF58 domain-containing protein n=1 Tax=Flagellimonas halotolerans TaxID=3112164 RepID=A0ABU6ITN7_9FLAO|nr:MULTISPECIES: DUF58 domain-containing protein [unclassified Allomuricauda]MEC3966448.1 DUF58 domain-containing protein [Muricauda sp. SYSU M86414]MEC4266313.1 DUF58 domain-containing protein [Muricauda sp. SYSU M84420]
MASRDYHDLLKPEVINTVSGLSLISRIVVEGYTSGLNRSKSVGPGMEFSQYRGYEPGDDLRLLDWKMLARSGRYYIKQSEVESHVTVKFIVDASASMDHKEDGISKLEFARIMVACLSHMAQKQGDSVGLFALNEDDFVSIYPKADKKHFNRLLLELLRISTKGKWPELSIASRRIHNRGEKELVFFLTDMYEDVSELSDFVKSLKTAKNEVVVLQIMSGKEMDFDYKKSVTFEDLETGAKVKVDVNKAKTAYLKALDEKVNQTKEQLLSQGVYYHLFRMDNDLGDALQLFLKERIRLV